MTLTALTRLHSAELGPISPLEFIEIAERRQLIAQLDLWVLEQASKFLNRLDQAGFSQIKIAINISGTELLNEDFINRIQQAVQKNNVDPKRLKLEVTESVMFAKFTVIAELFKELKNMGITIAIDDFGTGYSSFARLEELSTDLIKIDKSFIDRILTRNHDQLIIGDLIAMCHKMGLQVVAEGVEKESQRQYLLEKGCDFMQGFLFSRPLPPEQALQKIKGLN